MLGPFINAVVSLSMETVAKKGSCFKILLSAKKVGREVILWVKRDLMKPTRWIWGLRKIEEEKGLQKNPNSVRFLPWHNHAPSLVKCRIHHAGLVCRSQESLHLSSSPSISLPAHVSLSQAAKSWMTDCQLRCAVEGGPAKTGPWMVEGEVVHVSQSSAWPWGSSCCSTAPRQRSERDPLIAAVSN